MPRPLHGNVARTVPAPALPVRASAAVASVHGGILRTDSAHAMPACPGVAGTSVSGGIVRTAWASGHRGRWAAAGATPPGANGGCDARARSTRGGGWQRTAPTGGNHDGDAGARSASEAGGGPARTTRRGGSDRRERCGAPSARDGNGADATAGAGLVRPATAGAPISIQPAPETLRILPARYAPSIGPAPETLRFPRVAARDPPIWIRKAAGASRLATRHRSVRTRRRPGSSRSLRAVYPSGSGNAPVPSLRAARYPRIRMRKTRRSRSLRAPHPP